MKKKSFYLCSLFAAALMFTGCTDSEVTPDVNGDGKGEIRFIFNFEGADKVNSRAAKSTAIPTTSWDNVKNLQVLLADKTSGLIVSGRTVDIKAGDSQKATFTNVLVGEYNIVAVANVVSGDKPENDNVTTYGTGVNGAAAPWSAASMVGKNIKDMIIKHKAADWPGFVLEKERAGLTVWEEPSEIFMAYGTAEIKEDDPQTVNMKLQREVALMRVRLDVTHPNVAHVDWGQNATVFIYRLPASMKIEPGTTGGITASDATLVQISNGYETDNPKSGYKDPVIIADPFSRWKDIRVFPNNGGRKNGRDNVNVNAASKDRYFIVVSAKGKDGHYFKDGTSAKDKPIYWYNSIAKNFVPNTIREVNLTITTGGDPVLPPKPLTYGDLTVTFGAVEEWSGDIQQTDIIL